MTANGRRRKGVVALVMIPLGLGGCHHPASATGESSFEFQRVNRAGPPGKGNYVPQLVGTEAKNLFTPANPIGKLAAPAYPPAALAAHAGRTKVVLRVTVGTEGIVTEVAPALAGLPFANPFTDQFQAAAEAAVRTWRFEPAEVRRLEPRDAGGTTIWSVTQSEKREMTFEVTFTFTGNGPAVIDRK